MSSSSIDLSSILSALGSSSSGINVAVAVAQEIALESQPMQVWEQEQTNLQNQTSDIQGIESDISGLQSALTALNDPLGSLAAMTANSSNSNIVTASASAGAVSGTHMVVVNNLATTASWYSSSVASETTDLAAGSFTIQAGSGSPVTVTTGSGVNTLDDVVNYINGLNADVTASVVNDANGARLALVSTSSGAAGNFTVANGSGLTFTQATTGVDASLTVDGIPIDSASNTVTGAVTGLTLNLAGASSGTQVSISVAPDSTQISSAVSAFVSAYNKVVGDVNSEYKVDSNNNQGPLARDPVLSELQSMLLGVGSYTSGGASLSTLGQLGISMNNDGTLTLDSSTLNSDIQSNFADVQNFFQGTSSNGFASTLNNQMNSLVDSVSGAFTVDLQSITAENTDLQNQIDNFQSYLNTRQQFLTDEYNKADIALQQLPQLEAQLNAELGLNNNNKNS
ncbi:MAG TPA: flagellar filament capping protein FliD [Terriglobales bacterium]|nr:flagellar filament capping protein FliD [Terriglobales bacterium]